MRKRNMRSRSFLITAAVVLVAFLNDNDRMFVEARSRLAMGTSGGTHTVLQI